MRRASEHLRSVLSGSFGRDVTVDVWLGADRTHEGLRVESWSLDSDLGARVKTTGQAVVVYESVAGESVAPKGTKGVLSPFGAVLELKSRIVAGGFEEVVSLGLFKVVRVPASEEYTVDAGPAGRVVTGSRVEVVFDSLDRDLDRRGFTFAEAPPSLGSCWDEMRRISGMPVRVSLPDRPIPAATAWEAKQGGRLDAVQKLADTLGGTALVTSDGQLTVVPDEVGDPVLTLTVGEDGTITELGSEIETDTVYNEVVGVFEDEDRNPIYAVARVLSGPLRVDGPYGTNTRYYSSDFVKTQAQADAAVQSVLDKSIQGQTVEVRVRCHFHPLVEIGDVLRVVTARKREDRGEDHYLVESDRDAVIGQVTRVSISDDALMDVTLLVNRGL